MWWLYLNLFYSFFKIGLFGFGGGYAMISLIQGEVVNRHHWLTSGQFTDIVAISQMTPGPIGINSATYVGYTSIVNAGYGHVVEHVFMGLRPAVVGLLAAAALLLLTPENFSTPDNPWQLYISIFLFAFAFIGSLVYKMNPIKLICFCGLAGWILF